MITFFLFFYFINFLAHYILFKFDSNENFSNLFFIRSVFLIFIVSVDLLILSIFYFFVKKSIFFSFELRILFILIITAFLIHYVLDNDFMFQFSKKFNLYVLLFYEFIIIFCWVFLIVD